MRIDGLPQQPKVSQPAQRGSAQRARENAEESRDVVEISQQGAAELSTLARSAPADNTARLQQVRARVRAGEYDTPEARRRIAEALLGSPGMSSVLDDVAQVQAARQQLPEVPDTRQASVTQAQQRLQSGFYDQPQVRRDTAARILDELA